MKTRNWLRATAAMLFALTLLPIRAAEDDPKPAIGITNAGPTITIPATPDIVVASTNTAPMVRTATNAESANTFQLPKLSLPPLLDQVVRLNQSGADESVVRAYIEKAAPPYQITGNEIIQLQDLGVSKSVILALIEHSKTVVGSGAVAPSLPAGPATAPVPAQPAPTNDAEVGSAEAAADFREPLSPYGSWLEVPGYGHCWQPTVTVVNPTWQPYCDNGDWRWSDSGWYWHSYYSWGWAPFHYGRWFSYPDRGWLWCPDRVWGPSWVSWRNSAAYCGWAPLPPGACFIAGRGWTFRGASVGVDFSFGLGAAHFTFVAHNRFSERNIGSHAFRGNEASAHYRNTSVVNNYAVGGNNRIVNHGVGRAQIAASAQTPIREVAAAEPARVGNRIAAPSRVNLAAVSGQRPVQQLASARTGGARALPNIGGGGNMTRQASQATPVFQQRSPSRAIVAGGGTAQRATPNYSQNYGNRTPVSQPSRSFNAAPAPRYQPRNYSHAAVARPAAPRSFAQANGGSQRFAAPSSVGRSMPSGGGGQFRGSVSRSGGGASARSFGVRR